MTKNVFKVNCCVAWPSISGMAACFCVCLALTCVSWSQEATHIGFPANGVFSGSSFDSRNMYTGNLHIEIPILSTKGRGLPAQVKWVYDNQGWYLKNHCDRWGFCVDTVTQSSYNHLHWAAVTPFGYAGTGKLVIQQCSPGSNQLTTMSRYLHEPDGTTHHIAPDPAIAGGNSCWGPSETGYADDGSGWALTSGGLRRKDGMVPGRDTNGNQLILNGSTGVATDTLGRTFAVDGKSYTDSSGTVRTIVVTTTPVTIQTGLCVNSGADACFEYSGTWDQPSIFTLPNGMTYTFAYVQGAYGEPSSVTLPTGGQISWTWGGLAPGGDGGRQALTRTVTVEGQSYTWQYTGVGGPTDPYGNQTRLTYVNKNPNYRDWYYNPYTNLGQPYLTKAEYFQGSAASGQLLKTVQTDYATNGPILPIRETTTWNQQNLVTKTETDYDTMSIWSGTFSWGNPTEKREYAYGTGAAGSLVRQISFNYLHLTNTTYKNLNIADRPTSKTTYDGAGAIKAQTQYTYDGTGLTATSGAPNHDYTGFGSGFLTRGNPTQVKNWLNTNGTYLTTNNAYDDLGNLLTSTDPGGHVTTYSYVDDWANTACVPAGVNTQAYVTQITNHLSQRTQAQYFPCTGLPERTRDENDILAGLWGRIFTYDLMNRTLTVVQSDGGETDYAYNDLSPISMTRSSRIDGTQNLVSTTLLDGLGRASQSQLTSDPEGTAYGDTTYDALGRTATETNPYRSVAEPTYGITTTNYDALSRVTLVIPPDGSQSANNVSTVYAGNCVTVTDQAGKKRKSCADALGRLTQVFEPDAGGSFLYETDYQYDTLDNLTRVDQKGNDSNSANWRTRTFTYNSLSQLLTAVNPESGTINYTYDSDGNVLTKVAPLPNQTGTATVTTTYAYDALHRLTDKTYSNGDPTASYRYDGTTFIPLTITNPIGRRTGMLDGTGATAWSYDSEGRPLIEHRLNHGITKDISYTYNLDGSLASLTYPSGRTVNYAYNAAARPLSAIDTANGINYATVATYAPQGALAGVKYGVTGTFTGIVTSNSYNPRLQPVTLSAQTPGPPLQTVISLTYDFHVGVNNNGNVYGITNGLDGIRPNRPNGSAVYTYDQLNRIASAHTPGATPDCTVMPSGLTKDWGQTFTIDIWGNLTNINVERCSTPILNAPVNEKNQFVGVNTYDAAGNLWSNWQYPYDAENRMVRTAGVDYAYDGDGRRVKKSSGTLYWPGAGSDNLAESDLAGTLTAEYVFFGGKRMARLDLPSGVVHFYFSDHLGSHSVVTSANGGTIEQESDYYPFGGERAITAGPTNYKFTGKERDPESGLDYFIARYYSSSHGRFFSADWAAAPTTVPYAEFGDPQSLNLYSYVRNNPLSHADADGHEIPTPEMNFDGVAGLVEGAWNFAKNTVTGGAQVMSSPVPGLAMVNGSLDAVHNAVQDYKADGVSGTLDKLAAQGPQGATAIVAEAVLTGGAVASARVTSVMPEAGPAQTPATSSAGAAEAPHPSVTEPYQRPSGATTPEQRASVQGKPCSECGQAAPKMYANHKTPLVKEYYQTGTIDKTRMRSVGAVDGHCPSCSSATGGRLSHYSKQMKAKIPPQ